jgi:hypothetical protein
MTQAELYRAYAEACFRVAKTAAEESERARWLGMAQHWLQWAQDEDAKAAHDPSSGSKG